MARRFKVDVSETQQELKHRLDRASTAASKERLQMLYWIKTRAITTRQELAQGLGRDESTVYRWLQRYKHGGIAAMLEVKTAPGQAAKLSPEAMKRLREQLAKPQGFNSYGQIQQWLRQSCGVEVAYKTVHSYVRYKLKAKLKVPRPCSTKANPAVHHAFKKNFQLSLQ